MRWTRILPLVGGIATTVALAGMSAGTAFATDGDDSSAAYAVRAEATLLNSVTAGLPVQNKVVYSHGKGDERSMPNVDSKPLKAKGLHTVAKKEGAKAYSEADAAEVDALDGLFTATLVQASCTHDANGDLHGDVKIVNVVVAGQHLTTPNPQTINLLGGIGQVRINEQVKNPVTGVLTVNAIHIVLAGVLHDFATVDAVVASATCSANDKAGAPDEGTPVTNPKIPVTISSSPATTTPSATTVSSSAAPKASLPNTGANVAWLAGGAVILLGAGAGALWWTRRRAANHG